MHVQQVMLPPVDLAYLQNGLSRTREVVGIPTRVTPGSSPDVDHSFVPQLLQNTSSPASAVPHFGQ